MQTNIEKWEINMQFVLSRWTFNQLEHRISERNPVCGKQIPDGKDFV